MLLFDTSNFGFPLSRTTGTSTLVYVPSEFFCTSSTVALSGRVLPSGKIPSIYCLSVASSYF